MDGRPKLNLRHIVGIVVVVVGVAALYLVLANLLFSRTYDMLSASMKARCSSRSLLSVNSSSS